MDERTRRHSHIVAALLFGLAVEELALYPQSDLASWVFSAVLIALIYWLIAMSK